MRGRPWPHFSTSWGSCGWGSVGGYTVPLVSDSWGFGSISGLNLNNLDCRYGLTTID